jgi:uncharacterized protein YjbI with pentapeptide repeats
MRKLLAILWGCVAAFGQANLSITAIKSTNGNVNVQWDARSLVPPPGVPVFVSYKIWGSTNLHDWEVIGETLGGSSFPNQRVSRDIMSNRSRWNMVKVESVLNFSGLDLIGLPLDGANFERARFTGCDFFGASLQGANLRGARFEGAEMRGASLEDSDLSGANFMGAVFFQANLSGIVASNANLSFADFTGANLAGADLRGADLRFASLLVSASEFISLHRAKIDAHTRLDPKTELVWKIVNGKMAGATITNQDLVLCDLSVAELEGTVFGPVDLRGSSFLDANLINADLRLANLDFVDWRGAGISNAILPAKALFIWQVNNEDFSERNLADRDLSNAALVRARLANAVLTRANFQQSILVEASLSGADLRSANFTDADLAFADLREADLTGAVLRNTDFTRANLRDAKLPSLVQPGTIFRDTIMPDGTVRNPSP